MATQPRTDVCGDCDMRREWANETLIPKFEFALGATKENLPVDALKRCRESITAD